MQERNSVGGRMEYADGEVLLDEALEKNIDLAELLKEQLEKFSIQLSWIKVAMTILIIAQFATTLWLILK